MTNKGYNYGNKGDEMKKKIRRFLMELKGKDRKRFDLDTLEEELINAYKGQANYLASGGYLELYKEITYLM